MLLIRFRKVEISFGGGSGGSFLIYRNHGSRPDRDVQENTSLMEVRFLSQPSYKSENCAVRNPTHGRRGTKPELIMAYPYTFTARSDKTELVKTYLHKELSNLPTPSLIVDRSVFKGNCEKMLLNASLINADFRAHVKTHKTMEGTLLQLGSKNLTTKKIVVSTLMEAWGLLPLIEKGLIDDVLFSLPVLKSRLPELAELSTHVTHLRLMLDNKDQLDVLSEFSKKNKIDKKWSVFIKINMGTNRAGFEDDAFLDETLEYLLTTSIKDQVSLYGFYCHAGHSYSSSNVNQAKSFLLDEITSGNSACEKALKIDSSLKLQLSVGATPTAHASKVVDLSTLGQLYGKLELHAGNYPFCDLQQMSTGCIGPEQVSCKVLAEVISSYPGRGTKLPGEQLINAGVIALAREFGPLPGHGRIYSPKGYENWIVGRLSQEHGILTPLEEKATELIPLGTKVKIVPQHSCITAASYPWYFVVDNGNTVVDIWVPWRGW
ncbi:LAMI_0G17810g1_1 [Lachancea mirantina]|uniref:D-serine dehydratase n=1 Tax=Lachancea mirantina TaxID=1230905 RepID=A0A1G4KCW6_9SACH|nr:LAMI_0G17810g1_1 [Lachancea mirantina]